MIASAAYTATFSITLPSGFSTIHTNAAEGQRQYITGYKIADSADVAASNFTFTFGSAIGNATASLLRFTTDLSFPANPILLNANPTLSVSTTTPSFTLDLGTGPASTFLVANFFVNGSATSSAQASSPSRTWTERNDFNASGLSSSIATAPNTAVETLSTFSLTTSVSINNPHLSFFVIAEQQSVSTNVSHLAVTPTIEGVTAAVSIGVNVGHLAVTPTINGVASTVSSDGTRWTPTNKS